jgi:hypothetical protein
MHVTVVAHEFSRLGFQAWEARILSRPGGSKAMFHLNVKEMKAEFLRHNGLPDNAVLLKQITPPTYLWHFASDVYVRFQIEEKQAFPFGAVSRKVLILNVTPHPPVQEAR